MKYQIESLHPRFQRDVKHLKKKFPKLSLDLIPAIDDICRNPTANDSLIGFANLLYKARIAIKSANIGEIDGLRLIYIFDEEKRLVKPICVYFKGDKENITIAELKDILKNS